MTRRHFLSDFSDINSISDIWTSDIGYNMEFCLTDGTAHGLEVYQKNMRQITVMDFNRAKV